MFGASPPFLEDPVRSSLTLLVSSSRGVCVSVEKSTVCSLDRPRAYPGISFGPIGSSPEKKESPKLSGSSNSGGSINGGAPASEALTLGLEKLFMELPGSVSAATTPVASS